MLAPWGKKAMKNLDNILKSRDITLLTQFCIVQVTVFPLVTYECELDMLTAEERTLLNCDAREDS